MSWKKEIEELRKREKLAEKMGGSEKLKKQRENKRKKREGKKTRTYVGHGSASADDLQRAISNVLLLELLPGV